MKRNHATLAALLAALSFFAAPSASAVSESQVVVIKKAVTESPAAEVAARAADLVIRADKADREEVGLLAVREAASKRPATIIAVVGAMAKVAPDLSPVFAAEASKLVAERSSEIAKAAAAGAPGHALQIASAVAKVAPKNASKVTRAVVTVAPEQSIKIVEAVVASVPSAKVEIQNDSTITRITRRMSNERMAGGNGDEGNFTTRPGTIRGVPPPNSPPNPTSTPVVGADPERQYEQ